MSRTRPAAIAAVAVVLAASGCSDGGADARETPRAGDDASWTTSTDPLDTRGLVWASADDVVHLPDGTTVDVGQPMQTWVVAGDGVYFTSPDAEVDEDNPAARPLLFVDRDGSPAETGVAVYDESLGASPGGRYLGFVDATSGEPDDFSGLPQGIAVVVDLTTGERVLESTEVMGDPDEDDLAHDYDETYLRVRFPDDRSAHVEGLGDLAVSLPDGTARPTDDGPRSPSDPISPGGSWSIEDRGFDDRIVSADGDPVQVRTDTPRRDLRWWLDDSTVVGIAIAGPGEGQDLGPDDTSRLVTCHVPDGSCTPVDGTEGVRVRFPVGAGDEGLDLGATGGGS